MKNFKRITIIGLGLIGGSMALALKKSDYNCEVIGYDVSEKTVQHAKGIGAIDVIAKNLQESVEKAELIILATPVGYYEEMLQQVGHLLSNDVIVTDVGSVKGYVAKVAEKYLPEGVQFIGGHPMAGSEKGGIEAATPFLYENAYYFLTPRKQIAEDILKKLQRFVEALGAYPVVVSVEEHDQIVAQISHIPHLTAVLLANMVDRKNGISYIPFVGGGFRDTTRIAAGNPQMWREIFLLNKEEVLDGIGTLETMLGEFKEILQKENQEEILENLQKAKMIRNSIPHTVRDYIPPLYELSIDVEDRPGVLGELTQLMGSNTINIKEIEILHAREGEKGAIRIGLDSEVQQKKALHLLQVYGFAVAYREGGNSDHVNNKQSTETRG
ncbi:MAG: prephenate dehydrogenase [Clostridiaceae bacterium]|nr:prephenate dehydrogenase [Clostridiaceae bacterium]